MGTSFPKRSILPGSALRRGREARGREESPHPQPPVSGFWGPGSHGGGGGPAASCSAGYPPPPASICPGIPGSSAVAGAAPWRPLCSPANPHLLAAQWGVCSGSSSSGFDCPTSLIAFLQILNTCLLSSSPFLLSALSILQKPVFLYYIFSELSSKVLIRKPLWRKTDIGTLFKYRYICVCVCI